MMQPADLAGLHWQPLAATERERLFDQLDAYLAHQRPARPDEWPDPPAPTPDEIRAWWEQEQRERRFYQADPEAYVAGADAARAHTDPPSRPTLCPACGNPCLRRHFRYGPGGVACCPNCGWEEPPF